jgi:hypothetical protein
MIGLGAKVITAVLGLVSVPLTIHCLGKELLSADCKAAFG